MLSSLVPPHSKPTSIPSAVAGLRGSATGYNTRIEPRVWRPASWQRSHENRFKVLGANRFGFEDQAGDAGNGDFNDLVLSFASQQIL